MRYSHSELFYRAVQWFNALAIVALFIFTGYVISGDASAVNGWYGAFFAATAALFVIDFFFKRSSATQAMWIAVVWVVVWMLWLFAATLTLLQLPHMQETLHNFNGILFLFLAASVLNFLNLFPLFGIAFNERTGWNRQMKM